MSKMGVGNLFWKLVAFFPVILSCVIIGALGDEEAEEEEYYEDESFFMEGINCEDGILVPFWPGSDNLSSSDRLVRGIIYFICLLYSFLGIGVYLNKLMESTETMTSLMKTVKLPDPETGNTQEIITTLLNRNVANIFMVLVSSSPIIWLVIAEVVGKGFHAGDLAPFTVMGSSAFNLMIVIGVIISAVPRGQVKKVQNLWTLVLLTVWSFILYFWIFIPSGLFSYGVIEIWEAAVTFILFLIILISTTIVYSQNSKISKHQAAISEYEKNFQLYKLIWQRIADQHPELSKKDLMQKVSECGACRRPKSWAYYITQATNKIAGRSVPQNIKDETQTYCDENGENLAMTKSTSDEPLKIEMDKIILRANNGGVFNGKLWSQQFKDLFNLQHLGGFTVGNLIIHILTWPWKLVAAFIPPASFLGGYPAFILSSIAILIRTIYIHDMASHLGCFIFCKDILTGFILLSIGLNIPNLVAAKLAAAEEVTADLPLICLLAGNCLTTSLGFGLSWLLGSIYWETQGKRFQVDPSSLGYCINLFFSQAFTIFIILLGRRSKCCAGGELGGNLCCKIITTIVFFLLWITMLVNLPLEAYGIIQPGF